MPNSTYDVVLATEFDQELFDECYTDSATDVTTFFNILNAGNFNTMDLETTKAALANDWTEKLSNSNITSFKIYDNINNLTVAYALGKVHKNNYLIYCILYKNNNANNKEWVDEFWQQNNCTLENKTPRNLWNHYSVGFQNTSPLASMLKQKYNIDSNKLIVICVPRYASFETNYNEQQ